MKITKKDRRDFIKLIRSREFRQKFSGNKAYAIIMEIEKDKEVELLITPVSNGLFSFDLFSDEDIPENDLLEIADMVKTAIIEVYGGCIYKGVAEEWQYLNYPNYLK